jgi:hypothetical protein
MSAESFRILIAFPIAVFFVPPLVASISNWKAEASAAYGDSQSPLWMAFQTRVVSSIYLAILVGTALTQRVGTIRGSWSELDPFRILAAAMLGGIAGLAWFWGLIMLLGIQRLLLPSQPVGWDVPALFARGLFRPLLVVLGPIAIESWRCAAIYALLHDGLSGRNALIICTIAYALPILHRSFYRAAHGVLEGLIYGNLFLWQGTAVAPIAAHFLLAAGMAFFFRRVVGAGTPTQQPILALCPQCKGPLTFHQMKWDEAFTCPHCGQTLAIVNWRRTQRLILGLSAAFVFCIAVFTLPSNGSSFEGVEVFLCLALGSCASLGFVLLVQSAFPPKLEPGNPDMPSLDLTRRLATRRESGKNSKDDPSSPNPS